MLELRILVERGSLLPVLYSDMSHNDMEVALRSSPHRHVSGRDWDSYVQRVRLGGACLTYFVDYRLYIPAWDISMVTL